MKGESPSDIRSGLDKALSALDSLRIKVQQLGYQYTLPFLPLLNCQGFSILFPFEPHLRSLTQGEKKGKHLEDDGSGSVSKFGAGVNLQVRVVEGQICQYLQRSVVIREKRQTMFVEAMLELFELQRNHAERCLAVYDQLMPGVEELRAALEEVLFGRRVDGVPSDFPLSSVLCPCLFSTVGLTQCGTNQLAQLERIKEVESSLSRATTQAQGTFKAAAAEHEAQVQDSKKKNI